MCRFRALVDELRGWAAELLKHVGVSISIIVTLPWQQNHGLFEHLKIYRKVGKHRISKSIFLLVLFG